MKLRTPDITVTPRETPDALSVDEIIQRRLTDSPFGIAADAIPCREPGRWAIRIANSQTNESRHYQMVHAMGYVPFTVDDLPGGITPNALGFRLAEDGKTLVRGHRGDEVVYKMPRDRYEQIQLRKAELNLRGTKSESAAKAEVAEAANAALGGAAADYLDSHVSLNIRDSRQ